MTAVLSASAAGGGAGLNVSAALRASGTPAADAALHQANQLATEEGVTGTPTFLVGRTGRALRVFQPASLTAGPFEAEINGLLTGAHEPPVLRGMSTMLPSAA